MQKLTRVLYPALALLGSLVWAASSSLAVAASAHGQQPCEICPAFTAEEDIPVIRSINFNAPGTGTAVVTFHGSLFCAGTSTSTVPFSNKHARVDLIGQIVSNQNHTPDLFQPGALRLGAGLDVITLPEHFSWFHTFNLTSTRLFAVNGAGARKYHFKITRLVQDSGINCHVYNAAFAVLFTP
jgi:hypothetical protein